MSDASFHFTPSNPHGNDTIPRVKSGRTKTGLVENAAHIAVRRFLWGVTPNTRAIPWLADPGFSTSPLAHRAHYAPNMKYFSRSTARAAPDGRRGGIR